MTSGSYQSLFQSNHNYRNNLKHSARPTSLRRRNKTRRLKKRQGQSPGTTRRSNPVSEANHRDFLQKRIIIFPVSLDFKSTIR